MCGRLSGPGLDRARRQQTTQQTTQQARLLFHDRHHLQIFDHPRDDFHPQFLVGIFASAVLEGDLHFITFVEEFADVTQLGLKVVLIHAGVELDFLDLLPDLRLARLFALDAFLIAELAEVHDLADWRIRIRGDLDQIETLCVSGPLRVARRHDAEHAPIRAEHPDSRDANLEIGTNERCDG